MIFSRSAGVFGHQSDYRLDPILKPRDLPLARQPYFPRVECDIPTLYGLDLYEMIGGGDGRQPYR